MPTLKRLTKTNIVPIIDFDEYNKHQSDDLDLKYILYNVYDVLPRLSEFSASTILLRVPSQADEALSFHKFPKCSKMDIMELKKHVGPFYNEEPGSDDLNVIS